MNTRRCLVFAIKTADDWTPSHPRYKMYTNVSDKPLVTSVNCEGARTVGEMSPTIIDGQITGLSMKYLGEPGTSNEISKFIFTNQVRAPVDKYINRLDDYYRVNEYDSRSDLTLINWVGKGRLGYEVSTSDRVEPFRCTPEAAQSFLNFNFNPRGFGDTQLIEAYLYFDVLMVVRRILPVRTANMSVHDFYALKAANGKKRSG